VRRLSAIALLLDGHSREVAAVANGMTRQTLRDWVHRFNADGVTGLRSRASPGRPSALNETRREELKSIVLEGADPEQHRVVRWRRIDLCEEVAARWSVGAAVIMPAANSEAMCVHLKEISTQVSPDAHAVLVCDGAGWHQRADKLTIPELPLPAYSPELKSNGKCMGLLCQEDA